jgi:hypothetical protein
MKFMVEFRLKPGRKNHALELFESRGPNRNPAVTFRGAWIGADSDQVFVLVEAPDELHVEQAAESWSQEGEYKITRVIDIEQY